MSTFASIAVLSKPTEMHPDWEFEMEGLKFEVHDGMVELNQEIRDFEKFSASLDSIFSLIDNITGNGGKLDESVYALVNQNNELADALGIYTPFDLKTEAGQCQAGFELCMALEEDQNNGEQKPAENNNQDQNNGEQKPAENNNQDDSSEEEKGFFAKAWDAIKRFFKAIKDAVIRVWHAITGSNTSTEGKAKEIADEARNETPEKTNKIVYELGKELEQAGTVRHLAAFQMDGIAIACKNIAEQVSKAPSDPAKFAIWTISTDEGVFFKEYKYAHWLNLTGYKIETIIQDGKSTAVLVKDPLEQKTKEEIRKSWSIPSNRVALEEQAKEVAKACALIEKSLLTLTNGCEKITNDPATIEAIAKGIVEHRSSAIKEGYEKGIYSWKKKALDAAQSYIAKKTGHDFRLKKAREEVQIAMALEKELAAYCKALLQMMRTLKADFDATIDYLHRIVKRIESSESYKKAKHQAELEDKASKWDAAEKQRKESEAAAAEKRVFEEERDRMNKINTEYGNGNMTPTPVESVWRIQR